MKIIHTSDWHLGHEMYNYRRQEEFEDFFRQLRGIVAEEQPDALLVSGDVYHSTIPTIMTQTLYTEAMLSLHEACPTMQTIVTAGNHDSASRLEIDRSLWQHFHVQVVGGLARSQDPDWLDHHIIPVADKGWVVAVPHVYAQNFPPSDTGDRQKAFFTKIMRRACERNTDNLPIVLMAHLAVQDPNEPHAYALAGNMDFHDVSSLGKGYDYAALGHLHRPSLVTAASTAVRYCGSPLPTTFNEDYMHSVTVARVEHGMPPLLDIIPITPLRQVHTIPEQPTAFEEALNILSQWPDDDPSYLRLNVLLDEGLPVDATEQALRVTEGKKCRFCTFHVVDNQPQAGQHHLTDISPEEFRELQPLEIAARYLESEGIEDGEWLEMMRHTIEMMNMEDAQ